MAELTFRSRLQGTPYNLSSDLLEHQRLSGIAPYQMTNQQEFDALRGTVGGSFLGPRPPGRPLNSIKFERFASPSGGGLLSQSVPQHRNLQNLNLTKLKPMRGGGLLSQSVPQHRNLQNLNLTKLKPMRGGSLVHRPMSQGQREEYVLRVKSEAVENPRTGKTERIDIRPMSGRSTEAIEKQRKQRVKQGDAIMKVNTRKRMKRSPELLDY